MLAAVVLVDLISNMAKDPNHMFYFSFTKASNITLTSLLQIKNIHSLFIDLLFITFLQQGK